MSSAAPSGAYLRVDITHEFEDIRDIIYDVSPEETPFFTAANQASADNTYHEWPIDQLDAADVTNKWHDGAQFAQGTITPPVMQGNRCQISRKDIMVTRRARRINKAGPRDELARQLTRKSRELKRDMESILLNNQSSLADDGTNQPTLGGFPAWLQTNTVFETGGADGGFSAGVVTLRTDAGTPLALAESQIKAIELSIWNNSGEEPNCLMMGGQQKQGWSAFQFGSTARIATPYQDHGANPRGGVTVVGAVDVYVGDFDVLDVVPNRFQRTRDVFIYNTEYTDVAYFDGIQTNAMGKRGDTEDRLVLADYTLVLRNERTAGMVADKDPAATVIA